MDSLVVFLVAFVIGIATLAYAFVFLRRTAAVPAYAPDTYSIPTTDKEGSVIRQNAFFQTKAPNSVAESGSVYEIWQNSAKKFADLQCFGTRPVIKIHEMKRTIDGIERVFTFPELGPYEWITYRQANERVNSIASGLSRIGVKRGVSVAIYEDTRVEWSLASRACYCHSSVVFTVYSNLGEDGLVFALNQGEIRYMVTNASKLGLLAKVSSSVPSLKHVVYIGNPNAADVETLRTQGITAISFESLEADGAANPVPHDPPTSLDDLACIMYTSGSTGNPKGVMINHRNLLTAITGMDSENVFPISEKDFYLAYLPLAHIFAFACESSFLAFGASIGFGSPRTIFDIGVRNCRGDLAEFRPTVLMAVPAVYQRLKHDILAAVSKSGTFSRILFNTAVSIKLSAIRQGRDTPLLNKLVFSKFGALLGGRVRYMVSGSAPLNPEVHDLLRVCFGASLIQGYGLTETCSSGCVQYHSDLNTSRIGAPVPSIQIKLVDVPEMNYTTQDKPYPRGEIWLRGGTVSVGYYREPEKTRESFHDGWLATGDIGVSHPDGTFSIIDRKKNLIKPPHGEYIALEKLESVYRNSPFVESIIVYVDSDHYHCVAALVPNREPLMALAKKIPSAASKISDFSALCSDPEVQRLVLRDLQAVGSKLKLKSIEMVRAVRLLPEQWTPQNFFLTAAMKLNRGHVVSKIRPMIDEMYEELEGQT